jgi:hypothetical protein
VNIISANLKAIRGMSEDMKTVIRKLVRVHPELTNRECSHVDFMINERAFWKAQIDYATENGKVGIVVAGRDCDCTQYEHHRIVDAPRSIVKWCNEHERHLEYLDGPETTTFCKPSTIQDGYSMQRDLALEAFENGHPHFISLSL